jgi:threonine 3-dehydrogenase
VVKKKRDLGAEITTVDMPKIGKNEVPAKVKAASICGIDIHIWDWNEWAKNPCLRLGLR